MTLTENSPNGLLSQNDFHQFMYGFLYQRTLHRVEYEAYRPECAKKASQPSGLVPSPTPAPGTAGGPPPANLPAATDPIFGVSPFRWMRPQTFTNPQY